MNQNLYRYAEQALREYVDDCQRMKLLEEYLAASSPSEVSVQGGEMIAEQERIIERKSKDTEWRGLLLKVGAVAKFLETLGTADMALVKLRYFEQLPWSRVAEELHTSEPTCRCRWGPKLVKRAARYVFGDLSKI